MQCTSATLKSAEVQRRRYLTQVKIQRQPPLSEIVLKFTGMIAHDRGL